MSQQTGGALWQSQQRAAAAASVAESQGGPPQSISVVDTRLLWKPERWNSEQELAGLTAAVPSTYELLERAENGEASDPALCTNLSPE